MKTTVVVENRHVNIAGVEYNIIGYIRDAR